MTLDLGAVNSSPMWGAGMTEKVFGGGVGGSAS